jgi:hypothetical protein
VTDRGSEESRRTAPPQADVRAAVNEYLSQENEREETARDRRERTTQTDPASRDRDGGSGSRTTDESSVRAIVDEYLSDDANTEADRTQPARAESSSRERDRSQAGRRSVNTPAGTTAAVAGSGAGATGADGQESPSSGRSFDFEGINDIREMQGALLPIDIGWLFAALLYGGLDMFSTVLVLNNGGSELNPIYSLLGESLGAFVIWKTLVVFALFVVFYPDDPTGPEATDWVIPAITGVAGLFLTVNNILVLTTGSGII